MSARNCTVFGLLVMISHTGCGALDDGWQQKLPWQKKAELVESQYEQPMRMAAIWTPDVLTLPGKPAVRGFGGRLYFYNQLNQPIPVEGQLIVYAYDDSQQTTARQTPTRKFAFTPDQFTEHYGESELGASYSIWLPWDRVGGEQATVTFVPVFRATGGQVVMGQQALNVLPGKASKSITPVGPPQQMTPTVEQVGYHQPAPEHNQAPRQRMQTTTISVPPSLQERMKQAALFANRSSAQAQPPAIAGSLSRQAGPSAARFQAAPVQAPAYGYAMPGSAHPAAPQWSATAPGVAPAAYPPSVPEAGTLGYPPQQLPGGQAAGPTSGAPAASTTRAGTHWRKRLANPDFTHPFSQLPAAPRPQAGR